MCPCRNGKRDIDLQTVYVIVPRDKIVLKRTNTNGTFVSTACAVYDGFGEPAKLDYMII